jgi:hypothetical protein
MGRACSMHAGEKEYIQGFHGKVKKRDQYEDEDVGRWIILR